jgi:cyclase
MAISRKNFIKSASLIAGGVLFGFNRSLPGILRIRPEGFRELRNNIGIYTERGGTMGWYYSDGISAVIDSQFPDTAEHFMEGFSEKTTEKIDFLFNTHHHGDHTSGNFFLKKHTDNIVAHENCPVLQKKQSMGKENEEQQVYANMTFKTQWQRDVGKETINAQHLGPAHTGGDAIIYFEKANIAHLGDLVFNGIYPYIDLPGGGVISNWVTVLEKAADIYPEDTLFIFGHAVDDEHVTGKRDDLLKMRDYLSALLLFVEKEIADGKNPDAIIQNQFVPGFEHIVATREKALESNLQAAYNELMEKKL